MVDQYQCTTLTKGAIDTCELLILTILMDGAKVCCAGAEVLASLVLATSNIIARARMNLSDGIVIRQRGAQLRQLFDSLR